MWRKGSKGKAKDTTEVGAKTGGEASKGET